MTGLSRATTYAIRKESTPGVYLAPSAGAQFVPLRPKNDLSFDPEILTSDELINDIGETKGAIGKLSASGTHSAYLKHSGVEGQEPELGLLYESLFGSKFVAAVEYDTIAASTTTVIKVAGGEGALFRVGQALLLKDSTNGYSIRNISSISGDDLTLNFKLASAPALGVLLGKAILYIPVSIDHPTFSATKYLGNGHAVESAAGNTVTELSIKADANQYAEADFSFQGTKYFYNAIVIGATNKYLDVTDDQGTFAVSVPEGVYATPIELAAALALVLDDNSSETFTVTYDSVTGKFTIASGSVVLSLLFATGANAANSIGVTLGYTATDKVGSVSYLAQAELSYAMLLTPAYDDNAEKIVMKNAELLIGSVNDNVKISAQSVSIKISKEVEDEDDIGAETGVASKITVKRSVEMTVTATLKKHDAKLLSAFLNNSNLSAMLNAGPKTTGNWIAGKCFNLYMKTASMSGFKTTGESFVAVEITLKGFVTSTTKDVYLGFA